jgi:2-amino-4-hydroxy-6-hydroxymethyldihydropteridine diphosphokinase
LEKVYLSLGSNIGDSLGFLREAVKLIDSKNINVTAVSPVYKTDPWGKTDQDLFLNCAVEAETDISPWQLKTIFREIENTLGKDIKQRWGERTIDIDIIFYGNKIIYEKKLIIPHPRFHLRNFVLIPLCDISDKIVDPVTNLTTGKLKDMCRDECKVEFFETMKFN